MIGPKLIFHRLRFPVDLDPDAALAALSAFSGLPFRARVVLEVHADPSGITHRLGVSEADAGLLTANLRAAMPSLRLEPCETLPTPTEGLLIQLSPALGALRTEDPAAISAALLSSLFPLGAGESITLRWRLRSAALPPLPAGRYTAQDGRERILRAKLMMPGLAVHGELNVQAASKARRRQLTHRVAAVLWSLSTPYGRLASDPWWLGQLGRLVYQRGRYMNAKEVLAVIGWPVGEGLDLPGLELGAAKRLAPSNTLPEQGRVLGTSDFPGLIRPVAISSKVTTSLHVLGPTGTGKTSLLKNLIRDALDQNRALICIETNGDLTSEVIDAIPDSRVDDVVLLDPTDEDFAVGFNPLASGAEPSLIADQLEDLFERIWADSWGPRSAALAHMALLTLAKRPGSTLIDLPLLYREKTFRAEVIAGIDDPIGLEPDWQWFESLSAPEKASFTAPLLNKSRVWAARPSLRAIVGQAKPKLSIRQIIEEKKVLLVNLPKGLIGNETAQLLGCLVLLAIWQAMTERAAIPPEQRHPVTLVVDEAQDLAAAPVPWDEMLAQGRKYGLSLVLAHQNLDQLTKELRETLLANARSKAVFALSASDAKVMEREFRPALGAADLQALDPYSVAALIALENGGLARPVTLRTPPPPKSLGSASRVRWASRRNFARPRAVVEADLRSDRPGGSEPNAPVGRRRRSTS